jgi:hypothetical protein
MLSDPDPSIYVPFLYPSGCELSIIYLQTANVTPLADPDPDPHSNFSNFLTSVIKHDSAPLADHSRTA